MRLDHLLSKGFIITAGAGGAGSPPWGGARGPPPSSSLVFPPRAGPVGVSAWRGVWGAWHAVGFWGGAPWLWPAWPVPLLECGGVWVVVGGLVVICIVDASII